MLAIEEKGIPYELVATKLNFYYKAIKNEWSNVEDIHDQVQKELDLMEENQDVLLYFSLLEFRHQLMLEYKYPKLAKGVTEKAEVVQERYKALAGTGRINSLLEYYYNFFTGMFHFKQGELIESLSFYRVAEKYLDQVEGEEIEKAEFYFKLSEVYYHMKQTYFSMNYAQRAYRIYCDAPRTPDGKPTYVERKIQCQFVISGNWLDSLRSKEALEHAKNALRDAQDLDGTEKNAEHLQRKALFNLGICYNQMEELDVAAQYFLKSLEIPNADEEYTSKTLFMISFIRGKQGNISEAKRYYKKAKKLAEKHSITVVLEKLKMVSGLFLAGSVAAIKEAFMFFDKKRMYPDMEEYGIEVAELLSAKKEIEGAIEFYRWSVLGRKHIKRGEMLNEN